MQTLRWGSPGAGSSTRSAFTIGILYGIVSANGNRSGSSSMLRTLGLFRSAARAGSGNQAATMPNCGNS